jgi:hypothetical protein
MRFPANDSGPTPRLHRVGPVEPDLLASAVFLFAEYLRQLEAESADEKADEGDEGDEGPDIDTRAVLDLFAEELGTEVATTLNLYMRVNALFRLLAASPTLARMAVDPEDAGGAFTESSLLAAARLDLYVERQGEEGSAEFDPREFREALEAPSD